MTCQRQDRRMTIASQQSRNRSPKWKISLIFYDTISLYCFTAKWGKNPLAVSYHTLHLLNMHCQSWFQYKKACINPFSSLMIYRSHQYQIPTLQRGIFPFTIKSNKGIKFFLNYKSYLLSQLKILLFIILYYYLQKQEHSTFNKPTLNQNNTGGSCLFRDI